MLCVDTPCVVCTDTPCVVCADMPCVVCCRDIKMENIMLDEKRKHVKLVGESLTVI